MDLLSVNNDSKTVKGVKEGYLTGILYLAPHTLVADKTLCKYSTKGCRTSCLYTAGRGRMRPVSEARERKTRLFLDNQYYFMANLIVDVSRLRRKAESEGLTPCVRLNGTSDILWENISIGERPNIMAMFPDVQWYDYTKYPHTARALRPPNYDLTFSYAETKTNHKHAKQWLDNGGRVAAVMENYDTNTVVLDGTKYRVFSGDDNDLTFLKPTGVVLSLRPKGQAKHDVSGFVIRDNGVTK